MGSSPQRERIKWADIRYLADIEIHSHHISFKAYQYSEWSDAAGNSGICFEQNGQGAYNPTENILEAVCFVEGHIKWDGCANVQYPDRDGAMLHFCGRSDAEAGWQVIDRLYRFAATQFPYLRDGE